MSGKLKALTLSLLISFATYSQTSRAGSTCAEMLAMPAKKPNRKNFYFHEPYFDAVKKELAIEGPPRAISLWNTIRNAGFDLTVTIRALDDPSKILAKGRVIYDRDLHHSVDHGADSSLLTRIRSFDGEKEFYFPTGELTSRQQIELKLEPFELPSRYQAPMTNSSFAKLLAVDSLIRGQIAATTGEALAAGKFVPSVERGNWNQALYMMFLKQIASNFWDRLFTVKGAKGRQSVFELFREAFRRNWNLLFSKGEELEEVRPKSLVYLE